jgi:hypothetical protein
VLDGELGIDQAEHIVTALSLADDARAVLCLYVSCNPALIQEGIHAAAMRLAADTAGDNELAARIYWTLGRSGGSDPSWALQAFSAALKRIGGEDLPALQARLCLDFARCCSQIGRPDDAIEAARVATVFAGRAADSQTAETATILQAVLLLEMKRYDESARTIGPVVAQQLVTGVAAGSQDASIVLKQCISRAIRQLLLNLASILSACSRTHLASLARPVTSIRTRMQIVRIWRE